MTHEDQPYPLDYSIVLITSEDEAHPAKNIQSNHLASSSFSGWLSERFPEFPQAILIELAGVWMVSKMQILVHQVCVATRIELFVSEDSLIDDIEELYPDNRGIQNNTGSVYPNPLICDIGTVNKLKIMFKRLGYMSLDPNNKGDGNVVARELKSIFLDTRARTFKLVLHKNHVTDLNIHNQVGIVSIHLTGRNLHNDKNIRVEHSQNDVHISQNSNNRNVNSIIKENDTQKEKEKDRNENENENENSDKMSNKDEIPRLSVPPSLSVMGHRVVDHYTRLQIEKKASIEKEEYRTAGYLKSRIDSIVQMSEAIQNLNTRKLTAVSAEDFPTAAAIKEEIDRIKSLLYEDESMPLTQPVANNVRPIEAHNSSNINSQVNNNNNIKSIDMRKNKPINKQSAKSPNEENDLNKNQSSYDYNSGPQSAKGGIKSSCIPPIECREADDVYSNDPQSEDQEEATHIIRANQISKKGMNHSIPIKPPIDIDSIPAIASKPPNYYTQDDPEMESGQIGMSVGFSADVYDVHPLEGVDSNTDVDIKQLEPDPLPPALRHEAEGDLLRIVNEFRLRCILGADWKLREAAFIKLEMNLRSFIQIFAKKTVGHGTRKDGRDDNIEWYEETPYDIFAVMINVCRKAVTDTIANVFLAVCSLARESCELLPLIKSDLDGTGHQDGNQSYSSPRIMTSRSRELMVIMEPFLSALTDRIADTQKRVSSATHQTIVSISKYLGASFGLKYVIRTTRRASSNSLFPPKSLSNRCQVAEEAVGFRPPPPISMIASFCSTLLKHPSSDVRMNCNNLLKKVLRIYPVNDFLLQIPDSEVKIKIDRIVKKYGLDGAPPLFRDDVIDSGRPSRGVKSTSRSGEITRRESQDVMNRMDYQEDDIRPSEDSLCDNRVDDQFGSDRNHDSNSHRFHGNRKGEDPYIEELSPTNEHSEPSDQCQFCGIVNKDFADPQNSALDTHYVYECEALATCELCGQVIESEALEDHKGSDECVNS